ncbi:MAG: hypothetical protein WBO70_01980, partial [Erysipelotrichaceae bacterium]
MKINKKLGIVFTIIILVLAILIGYYVVNQKQNNTTINNSKNNEETSKNNDLIVVRPPEPNMSCYDYIMYEMEQPEFWDDSQRHPYSIFYSETQREDDAKPYLKNGTAWKLDDLDQAVFTRGYVGQLTYDFSTGMAYSSSFADEEYNHWKSDQLIAEVVDITNKKYTTINRAENREVERGEWKVNVNQDGEEIFYLPNIVEKSFLRYEEKFNRQGCPLLMKPKGTLEAYKQKKISNTSWKESKLIDNPWDLKTQLGTTVWNNPNVKKIEDPN